MDGNRIYAAFKLLIFFPAWFIYMLLFRCACGKNKHVPCDFERYYDGSIVFFSSTPSLQSGICNEQADINWFSKI